MLFRFSPNPDSFEFLLSAGMHLPLGGRGRGPPRSGEGSTLLSMGSCHRLMRAGVSTHQDLPIISSTTSSR